MAALEEHALLVSVAAAVAIAAVAYYLVCVARMSR